MKIAILSRYQDHVNRGVESFVEELSKRLSKNHQVDVFSGLNSDQILKIIRDKYDVVMPMNGRMQSLKASLGRMFGGYKLLIGGHSGIGRDDIWNIVVARPDVFVALTEQMGDWAKKWGAGIKIVKINNGVDLVKFIPYGEKLKFDLARPIILSVGSLVWYKQHEKALMAISKLKEGSLLIVGDGEEKKSIESLAKSLGMQNRFKIIKLNYEDMPKVYRSVDLFTLPSWDREAFGLVYLEAMATNLPVVAPNDRARKEIVGEAGLFVDVSNIESYAEAIKKALSKDWNNIPRKQAEKFSWDDIAKKYEDLLLKL